MLNDKHIVVYFADQNINHLADIFNTANGFQRIFCNGCREKLEKLGYYTDFAVWDEEGRFIGLKDQGTII